MNHEIDIVLCEFDQCQEDNIKLKRQLSSLRRKYIGLKCQLKEADAYRLTPKEWAKKYDNDSS